MRYFNADTLDVLSKGVCRRCKKVIGSVNESLAIMKNGALKNRLKQRLSVDSA
jgi:hypothetical protein